MLDLDRGPSPQSSGAGLGIVFYARKFVGLAGWVTAGLGFSGLDQGGFCGTSHGIWNNYSLHPFSWWKAKETEKNGDSRANNSSRHLFFFDPLQQLISFFPFASCILFIFSFDQGIVFFSSSSSFSSLELRFMNKWSFEFRSNICVLT